MLTLVKIFCYISKAFINKLRGDTKTQNKNIKHPLMGILSALITNLYMFLCFSLSAYYFMNVQNC